MVTWSFNAYCPKGHLNVLRLQVTDTGMLLKVDDECEQCLAPRTLGRSERRELRRQRRALKKWDGRL